MPASQGGRKRPTVPSRQTRTNTQRKMRSMTMATYFQSSFTCGQTHMVTPGRTLRPHRSANLLEALFLSWPPRSQAYLYWGEGWKGATEKRLVQLKSGLRSSGLWGQCPLRGLDRRAAAGDRAQHGGPT